MIAVAVVGCDGLDLYYIRSGLCGDFLRDSLCAFVHGKE
jgi:hypothetical protein